jgi:predicted DNA-binding transcriptional regulator AlpA
MTTYQRRFLRTPEAAAYLRLSVSTLAKMRLRGDGPLYSKLGARLVAYEQQHLDQWIGDRLRRSTSEAGPQGSQ